MDSLDSAVWVIVLDENNEQRASCKICQDGILRQFKSHCTRHEATDTHKNHLLLRNRQQSLETGNVLLPGHGFDQPLTENHLETLPDSLGHPGGPSEGHLVLPPPPRLPGFNWETYENFESPDIALSAEQQGASMIAEGLVNYYNEPDTVDSDDDSSAGERLENDIEETEVPEPVCGDDQEPSPADEPARKRARVQDVLGNSVEWFPWPDKITCTLDVLMHLPRSVFSQRQMDLFLWLLKVNNVDDVPSVKSMQAITETLQNQYGVHTLCYDGALGHRYYVNNLAQIIAQVRLRSFHLGWSNKIRPNSSWPQPALETVGQQLISCAREY